MFKKEKLEKDNEDGDGKLRKVHLTADYYPRQQTKKNRIEDASNEQAEAETSKLFSSLLLTDLPVLGQTWDWYWTPEVVTLV